MQELRQAVPLPNLPAPHPTEPAMICHACQAGAFYMQRGNLADAEAAHRNCSDSYVELDVPCAYRSCTCQHMIESRIAR
jgi:hypothetical protein